MIISIKDSLKLIGVAVVVICAVFVCTVFTNFYLDVAPLAQTAPDETAAALVEAQLLTAKIVPLISGGVLGITAAVMLAFYVKLYIDENARKIGILKAMGFYGSEIARSFWIFGFAVFAGAVLGYVGALFSMPFVYGTMTVDGMTEIPIGFHSEPLLGFVVAPSVGFTLLSQLYALICCRRPVGEMIGGSISKQAAYGTKEDKERPFLNEMCAKSLKANKSVVFLIVFASFCFSAMVQMSFSMEQLSSQTMASMILVIGLILAVTTVLLAVTSLVYSNRKNVAMMKAMGYTFWESSLAIFGGFIPFALAGFALGTGYQYGLLKIMVEIVFKNVEQMPDYNFSFPIFCYALLSFVVLYSAVNLIYAHKLSKTSVKQLMEE